MSYASSSRAPHAGQRASQGAGLLGGLGRACYRHRWITLFMVAVFLSIVIAPNVSTKQIGLGLAVAILIDATVVRLVLVPAVMELLGPANWWLPGWLDRLLPQASLSEDEPRPRRLPSRWAASSVPAVASPGEAQARGGQRFRRAPLLLTSPGHGLESRVTGLTAEVTPRRGAGRRRRGRG
jgi:MMPL family protein